MLNILWRNIKWRIKNPIAIIIPILQPLIWLLVYSAIGNQSLQDIGIDNYTAFILPGLIVLTTFVACCSSGMMNMLMKSNGSYFRILIAPVRRSAIVLGQILEGVIISFVEVTVLVLVSLLFNVRVASGIQGMLFIIVLIFLTAFFVSGIAYCISLMMPNRVVYETIMTAIVLPIFFLSSALFPVSTVQGGLKIAILINPFTHVINAIRSLVLQTEIIYAELIPVIVFFIVLGCFSFILANRKLNKQLIQ